MNAASGSAFDPAAVEVATHHLVGSERITSGDRLAVRRPSDGTVHAELGMADGDIVAAAVAAAREAFPAWRAVKPRDRGRLLRRWADLIEEHKEEIARIEAVVSSRPIGECRAVDVPTAAEYLRYYGEYCDKIEGTITASGDDAVSMVLREPYGVVAIITPWNFPLILSTWKVAPALAAGNCVVLKPSELTPFSMVRIAELALEAGLPPGVFNIVHGEGGGTGRLLTTHRDVGLVSFTGSTLTGGRIMADVGATGVKPVSLELGGKSPQLVFADCGDLDSVADHITWGITRNSGQLCYAGSRAVVERSVAGPLVERIAARMAKLKAGPTWATDTTLPPIISTRQADRIERLVDETIAAGAQIAAGGHRADAGGACYFEPTVMTGLTETMPGFTEEIFGPVLGVQLFDGFDEGVRLAQHPTYGLTASVFTRDGGKALRAAKMLSSGTVWINRWGRTADMMTAPFGGYGQSGFGKESGRAGIEGFTRQKAIWFELSEAAMLSHGGGQAEAD